VVEEGGEPRPIRHVQRQAQRLAAELGRGRLGGGGVDVADRDTAALARQRQRQCLTDAPAAAGDYGDLAVERARLLGHFPDPHLSTRCQRVRRYR
jgi:hypothetical protein